VLFNRYIDDQVAWINGQKVAAKRSGVLVPLAVFPSFVERLESAVGGRRSQPVDTTYSKLSVAIFHHITEIASKDEKYHDVVYMENYHFLWQAFAGRGGSVPALAAAVTSAEQKFNDNLNNYLKWNVEYEMKEFAAFSALLEKELKQTDSNDVQFTDRLSKHELRDLVKKFLGSKSIAHNIDEMLKRIRKHLPKNPMLVKYVFERLGKYFVSRFEQFEKTVSDCYQSERLAVPVSEIAEMFRTKSSVQVIAAAKDEPNDQPDDE